MAPPKVMEVMGVPSQAETVISVRGGGITLVAKLIPTSRLLSKTMLERYSLKCGV